MTDPNSKNIRTEFISMQEAAQSCPYSQEYLSLLARRGKIFAKKIGRNWYTTRTALNDYVAQQSITISLPKNILHKKIPAEALLTAAEPSDQQRPGHEGHSAVYEEFERLNPQLFQKQGMPKVPAPFAPPPPVYPPLAAPGATRAGGEQRPVPSPTQKNIEQVLQNLQMPPSVPKAPSGPMSAEVPSAQEVIKKLDTLSSTLTTFARNVTEATRGRAPGEDALSSEEREYITTASHSFRFRAKRLNAQARILLRRPSAVLALVVTAIVLLFIMAGGFTFGNVDALAQQIRQAFKDAETLGGHFAGTHADEVLLLDKAGNISIFGHVETQGQLRSYAPDGVAPIVVDSITKVENLNADYLDGLKGKDFTLAFVTKNGNVTYEDVQLLGNVQVGQTLTVSGATKLMGLLQVYGGLGVLSDAVFSKEVTLTGGNLNVQQGNLKLGAGTIEISNSQMIRNLNAEFLQGKQAGDFTLDYIVGNGNSTSRVAFFNGGIYGGNGSFATVGVAGSLAVGSSQDPSKSIFTVYSNRFTLDANGNANISGTTTTQNLLVSGKTLSSLVPSGSFSLGSLGQPWNEAVITSASFTNLVVNGTTANAATISLNLTVVGSGSFGGQLKATRAPTQAHTGTWPSFANLSDATLLIAPTTAVADGMLIAAEVGGASKFVVDAEGDVFANNLVLTGTTTQGTTAIAGDLNVEGNTRLGDAAGDKFKVPATLVINPLTNVGLVFRASSAAPFDLTRWTNSSGNTTAVVDKAGNFITSGVLQAGSTSTQSYSRFGTDTTNNPNWVSLAEDLLVSGDLETHGSAAFSSFLKVSSGSTIGLFANAVTGNVGIGTTNPTVKLQVVGNASVSADFELSGYASFSNTLWVSPPGYAGRVGLGTAHPSKSFGIVGDMQLNDFIPTIHFNSAGNTNQYYIGANISDAVDGGIHIGEGTGVGTGARLVIDGTGNVGIGTTVPKAKLEVVGVGTIGVPTDADPTGAILVATSGGSVGQGGELRFGFGALAYTQPYFAAIKGLGLTAADNTQGDLAFYTRNLTTDSSLTERMRILVNGNVGIGTATPDSNLDISGNILASASGNVGLTLRSAPTGGSGTYTILTASTSARLDFRSGAGTLADTIMSLTAANSRVGIGTRVPDTRLEVSTTANLDGLRVTDGTRWTRQMSGVGAGSFNSIVQANDNALIYSAGTIGTGAFTIAPWSLTLSGLRMTSAGDVGIGTKTPSVSLDIVDRSGADNVLTVEDSSGRCNAQPTTTGLTWGCSSDERLKTDIGQASAVLPYVAGIPLHNYTVRKTGERVMGPVAQDLMKAYPELVSSGSDGFLTVSELSPWMVVKAIQELASKSDNLERMLAASSGTASSSSSVIVQSGGGLDVLGTLAQAAEAVFQRIRVTGDIIAQGIRKTYFAAADLFPDVDMPTMAANWNSREVAINPLASSSDAGIFRGSGVQAAEQSKVDLTQDNGNYLATYGVDSTRGEIQLSGTSDIAGGEARVFFDHSFTAVISDMTPLRVMVTPTTASIMGQLYVATKTPYGFVVKELNGASIGKFDWLVIARRKGYESSDKQQVTSDQAIPSPITSPVESVAPLPTIDVSPSPLPSPSPEITPEAAPPSPIPSPEASPTVSETPIPSVSASPIPTPTPAPSDTPTPSVSPTPTLAPDPVPQEP